MKARVNQIDRRKYLRVKLIEKASYRFLRPDRHSIFTQNISEDGMCLLLDKEVSSGIILELKFRLPDKEPKLIKTYARVVWQNNFLTGVKFL